MKLDDLPKDDHAKNAIFVQKLNEHDDAIREIKAENTKQNDQLVHMDEKLDNIKDNTKGIVEVTHFTRTLCRILKAIGKIICWASGIVGAVFAAYEIYQNMGGGL